MRMSSRPLACLAHLQVPGLIRVDTPELCRQYRQVGPCVSVSFSHLRNRQLLPIVQFKFLLISIMTPFPSTCISVLYLSLLLLPFINTISRITDSSFHTTSLLDNFPSVSALPFFYFKALFTTKFIFAKTPKRYEHRGEEGRLRRSF